MKNNWTHERISRKAASLQYIGNNTQDVIALLAQHNMIGELFRDLHIQVYKDGGYSTTVNIGYWLVKGEDGKIRFYDDATFKLMYQPISDELERLRAFAREILDRDRGDDIGGDELQDLGEKHGLLVAHYPKTPCCADCTCLGYYERRDFLLGYAKCYRLAESLKEPS